MKFVVCIDLFVWLFCSFCRYCQLGKKAASVPSSSSELSDSAKTRRQLEFDTRQLAQIIQQHIHTDKSQQLTADIMQITTA